MATSFFTPEPASLSNCSLSTPDCEESVARLLERKEEPRARALYCHTLQVVRRARPGLEVEAEGRARTRDSHGVTGAGEQETDPLTGAMCLNMWVIAKFVDFLPANYITVVHQLEHFSPLAGRAWSRRTTASLSPDRWTRAGWLPWTWSPRCLSCHSPPHPPLQVCDHSRHLPVAALHRVLEEALHHHPDHLVRTTAYATLLHCLDCLPPSPTTARYWLQLLARTTPHQDPASGRRWEFDDQEPWRYLESVLESFSKEEEEEEESGPGLVLGLVAALLERDLVAWREDQLAGDSLALDWRPLVAHLLFPGDLSSTWGWRLERLCSVYCRRPSPVLRTLVRLAATLIAHRERVSPKLRRENSGKLELARCLAVQLPGLEEEQLGAELFQLQPSWLAALTSQLVLARLTRRGEEQEVPSMRTLISNYLDVPLEQEQATLLSTPRAKLVSGLSPQHKVSPRSSKRMSMMKRNQYGEIPLHGFAKRANLVRMRECLLSPGIDINAKDHAGWTPLHEAVVSKSVEAVKLLVDYQPHSRTLEQFFKPSSQSSPSPALRGKFQVDLLAGDQENGSNPVHEAVSNDLVEVVRLLLEAAKQGKMRAPGLKEVMESQTKSGSTLTTLARSEEMTTLLKSFGEGGGSRSRRSGQENLAPPGPLVVQNLRLFSLLLDLSLTKYIQAFSLGQVYGLYRQVTGPPAPAPVCSCSCITTAGEAAGRGDSSPGGRRHPGEPRAGAVLRPDRPQGWPRHLAVREEAKV